MMDFNINECVSVQLTDHGRAVHAAEHAMLLAKTGASLTYRAPKEDSDGWSRWQLWELMRSFGEHIGMGMEPCFGAVIRIPAKEPQ
jgi:hypothetical protein